MGVEASEEGYLAKIVVQEGEKDVPVGSLLCIVVENSDDVAAFASFSPSDLKASKEEMTVASPPSPPPPPPPPPPSPPPTGKAPEKVPIISKSSSAAMPKVDRVYASPLAKKIAADRQLDIGSVSGTGPGGRILASDLSDAKAEAQQRAADGMFADIEVTNIRRTIAKRLTEAKANIPHYYLSVDVYLDDMIKTRERLNETLKKEEKKLSLNDIIIKASALSCRAVPEVNSHWMDTYIRSYNYVDVSVAVMTEAGLMTPIVFNADSKGLLEISEEMATLGRKAKDGKLQPHEFQGGTFTVSNLGMFGVHRFSAIINPPQAAILAVGGTQKRVVMEDDRCVEKSYMTVTISCDHRVVDGAIGARWLQKFKSFIEKPFTMLL